MYEGPISATKLFLSQRSPMYKEALFITNNFFIWIEYVPLLGYLDLRFSEIQKF